MVCIKQEHTDTYCRHEARTIVFACQQVCTLGMYWSTLALTVCTHKGSQACVCMCVQAVLTALSNELLCVNTELRVVYDAYSGRQGQRPWAWGQPEHSAALNSAQLWLLLRECNVPEPDCSLAYINMALAQVRLSLQDLPYQYIITRRRITSTAWYLAFASKVSCSLRS